MAVLLRLPDLKFSNCLAASPAVLDPAGQHGVAENTKSSPKKSVSFAESVAMADSGSLAGASVEYSDDVFDEADADTGAARRRSIRTTIICIAAWAAQWRTSCRRWLASA
jgi:hypothetical protein